MFGKLCCVRMSVLLPLQLRASLLEGSWSGFPGFPHLIPAVLPVKLHPNRCNFHSPACVGFSTLDFSSWKMSGNDNRADFWQWPNTINQCFKTFLLWKVPDTDGQLLGDGHERQQGQYHVVRKMEPWLCLRNVALYLFPGELDNFFERTEIGQLFFDGERKNVCARANAIAQRGRNFMASHFSKVFINPGNNCLLVVSRKAVMGQHMAIDVWASHITMPKASWPIQSIQRCLLCFTVLDLHGPLQGDGPHC